MTAQEECDEARDRVINKTLDLIDNLDIDQARSLLRCFTIDEENFDPRALATVAKTVRATSQRSGGDYDALCHFPDGATARLNRGHLQEALAASAEAKRVAQQAAEHTQRTAKSSGGAATIPNVKNSSTNGKHGQQLDGAADASAADLGDLEFEKAETRLLIRDGHVTINNYYMNQGPEGQQEQKPQPQPQPLSHLCAQCNHRYFEKDNALQKNGSPPCGLHTGQVVYYGATLHEAWHVYGSHVAGEAWNCCRRRRHEKGCHPAFHRPA